MTDTFAKQLDELRYYLAETVAVLLCDAADRIEKLEAALRELSTEWDCCAVSKNMKLIARKALEEKTDD